MALKIAANGLTWLLSPALYGSWFGVREAQLDSQAEAAGQSCMPKLQARDLGQSCGQSYGRSCGRSCGQSCVWGSAARLVYHEHGRETGAFHAKR